MALLHETLYFGGKLKEHKEGRAKALEGIDGGEELKNKFEATVGQLPKPSTWTLDDGKKFQKTIEAVATGILGLIYAGLGFLMGAAIGFAFVSIVFEGAKSEISVLIQGILIISAAIAMMALGISFGKKEWPFCFMEPNNCKVGTTTVQMPGTKWAKMTPDQKKKINKKQLGSIGFSIGGLVQWTNDGAYQNVNQSVTVEMPYGKKLWGEVKDWSDTNRGEMMVEWDRNHTKNQAIYVHLGINQETSTHTDWVSYTELITDESVLKLYREWRKQDWDQWKKEINFYKSNIPKISDDALTDFGHRDNNTTMGKRVKDYKTDIKNELDVIATEESGWEPTDDVTLETSNPDTNTKLNLRRSFNNIICDIYHQKIIKLRKDLKPFIIEDHKYIWDVNGNKVESFLSKSTVNEIIIDKIPIVVEAYTYWPIDDDLKDSQKWQTHYKNDMTKDNFFTDDSYDHTFVASIMGEIYEDVGMKINDELYANAKVLPRKFLGLKQKITSGTPHTTGFLGQAFYDCDYAEDNDCERAASRYCDNFPYSFDNKDNMTFLTVLIIIYLIYYLVCYKTIDITVKGLGDYSKEQVPITTRIHMGFFLAIVLFCNIVIMLVALQYITDFGILIQSLLFIFLFWRLTLDHLYLDTGGWIPDNFFEAGSGIPGAQGSLRGTVGNVNDRWFGILWVYIVLYIIIGTIIFWVSNNGPDEIYNTPAFPYYQRTSKSNEAGITLDVPVVCWSNWMIIYFSPLFLGIIYSFMPFSLTNIGEESIKEWRNTKLEKWGIKELYGDLS